MGGTGKTPHIENLLRKQQSKAALKILIVPMWFVLKKITTPTEPAKHTSHKHPPTEIPNPQSEIPNLRLPDPLAQFQVFFPERFIAVRGYPAAIRSPTLQRVGSVV